jgi:signal transduction histidine kinase
MAAVAMPHQEAIPLRRRGVDLGARLLRALASLERQACDAGVAFKVRRSPSLPAQVAVDGDKLTWAVTALVGNALRYVPRGSRLRAGGDIEVDLACEAGALRIAVKDNGPGIPARALVAFHGTGDSEGSAPALSLIHEIVTAHGGRVDITTSTDAFDHGTTVTLIVPLP